MSQPETTFRWRPMEDAPRDTRIIASDGAVERETWWGKVSHVPIYWWCFAADPDDPESIDLWHPTEWRFMVEEVDL